MLVRFDATIDDVVDVTMRAQRQSKAIRMWRWQSAITMSLIFGGVLYFLLWQAPLTRLMITVVFTVLLAVFYLATYEDNYRKRVRKLIREQIGSDNPFAVTVELLDQGLSITQRGTTVVYEWPRIERVEETDDALYFYGQGAVCSAVRKRGFESQAMKDVFLTRANEYIQKSRGTNCSTS